MNENVAMTLDDAVEEIMGMLTGLDLTYVSDQDRYRAIARQVNRSMRSMALEKEWSYYSSTETIGAAVAGQTSFWLTANQRVRIINDDCVRLVDEHGHAVRWAYFLPRDALHKYPDKPGLWASVTRNEITFSRPLWTSEEGLEIQVPVMREPEMFILPKLELVDGEWVAVPVPEEVRLQEIDFPYPDVVILRAAFYYAQTDPVMQPRTQTLEAQYKDLFYQISERDDRNTDSPFENEFIVPVQDGLVSPGFGNMGHMHPHADGGRTY